jgi:hypothetical protein
MDDRGGPAVVARRATRRDAVGRVFAVGAYQRVGPIVADPWGAMLNSARPPVAAP